MDTSERAEITVPDVLVQFVRAPFRLQTYKNLLYLMLAFPLGLGYFVFLAVGLTAGVGLTIVWIGLFLLALVLAGTWAFAAFERQMPSTCWTRRWRRCCRRRAPRSGRSGGRSATSSPTPSPGRGWPSCCSSFPWE